MVLVAIAAAALATPGEYRSQRKCSSSMAYVSRLEQIARTCDQERAYCLSKCSDESYDAEKRKEAVGKGENACYAAHPTGFFRFDLLKFECWAEEAEFHEGAANDCRRRAEFFRRRRVELKSKLILPFLQP
jgi:hypothetical protein